MSWTRTTERIRRQLPTLMARPTAVLFAALLLAMVLKLLTPSLHTVYITDPMDVTKAFVTRETGSEALLRLADVKVGQNDICYLTNYPGKIESLSVQHAFSVKVNVDGEQRSIALAGGNVADALETAGVTLGEHDYTVPSLDAPVAQNVNVQVHRVDYQDTVTTEAIPYETEYQYSSLFYRNKRRTITVQEGSEGVLERTWRERWVDGEMESSQQIAEQVTQEPRNQIIKSYAPGAPVSALTGPDGTTAKPSGYKAVYTGKATGYSSRFTNVKGASGRRLGYGTCAVDPKLIPYGSLLYIESTDGRFVYGYAIAADTGTAMVSGDVLVDLFYESNAEARMNGVQHVNVYVVS